MVILDLEWNRGYDNKPLGEILQIGAVRVEYPGGPVTDTFNAYIRPSVHKRFDPGAKQLPDLRMSQESELDFVTALEMFRTWCGAEMNMPPGEMMIRPRSPKIASIGISLPRKWVQSAIFKQLLLIWLAPVNK